jgi:hypothetical protein
MNQRLERLDEVARFLQDSARALIEGVESRLGRKLLVVYGYRSVKFQMGLFRQGREETSPGIWRVVDQKKVVTDVKAGAHNVITRAGAAASVAIDVIPLRADGAADWKVSDTFWRELYELSWDYGLDPLGDEVGAFLEWDKGHLQEPGWVWKLDGLGLLLPVEEA